MQLKSVHKTFGKLTTYITEGALPAKVREWYVHTRYRTPIVRKMYPSVTFSLEVESVI